MNKIIDESIKKLIDSSINRFSSRRLIAGVHRLIAAASFIDFNRRYGQPIKGPSYNYFLTTLM